MEDSAAVFLLDQILSDAVMQKATDIHLTQNGNVISVSFRIGGRLLPYVSTEAAGPLLRRIKALSGMDVTVRFQPQDGAFEWSNEGLETLGLRVSASPTATGESVVLRLLGQQAGVGLRAIGMSIEQAQSIEQLLEHSSGLLLVAGPTGTGKTTTLYEMMRYVAARGRAVVSIEDPVEMPIGFSRQLEVRETQGMTFERALRAAMRQDPDVLMIGEIRDGDTARTVMHAALSGHLVLSTTHATDVIGASARLVEYGLPRSLVGDVLLAVVVQSFHRRACSNCLGAGCSRCRVQEEVQDNPFGFEVTHMTAQTRALLSSELPWQEVRTRCNGLLPLAFDGS